MIECAPIDTHPQRYLTAMHTVSFLSIPVNLFTIYCIMAKSTQQMSAFKWYLLLYQITSTLFDIIYANIALPVIFFPLPMGYTGSYIAEWLSIGANPTLIAVISSIPAVAACIFSLFAYRIYVIIPNYHFLKSKENVIGIFLGILRAMIRPLFKQLFEGFIVAYKFTSLPITIRRSDTSEGHIYLCIAFFFIYAIPTGAGLVDISPDQEEAKRWIVSTFSCAEPVVRMSIPRLHIYTPDSFKRLLITVLVLVVMIAPIGLAILGSALYFLRGASHLSKKTRRLQQKFFFFLLVQVSVPGIAYALPVFFLVLVFITMEPKMRLIGYLSLIFMGFHGTVSSLSLILCNEPYRKFVMEILVNKWWPKKNIKTPLLVSFTRPNHQIPAQ